MQLTFHNVSNLSIKALHHLMGEAACSLLETLQDRIVFIDLHANNTQIYHNQNIKNHLEFNVSSPNLPTQSKQDAPDVLRDSEITICLSNGSSSITPVFIVSSRLDPAGSSIDDRMDPAVKPRDDSDTATSFKLILSPKSHAELFVIQGSHHFTSYKHGIILEENATLKNFWMFVQSHQLDTHIHLERHVEVKKNAHFYDQQIFASQSNVQAYSNRKLTGECAKSFSSSCLLIEWGEFYYEPVQEHFAKNTQSFLNFNAVLTKRAKTFFRGLIILHKDAQKSKAYQENKNLLLSRNARADSEPRLEIIPNDVFCKHGCATAEMDSKQLYYLMSRGFNKQAAKNLIVKSFCTIPFLQSETNSHSLLPFIEHIMEYIFMTHHGILHS